LEVLVAETNRDESTYDGFDWGGERVAEEVEAAIAAIESSGRKVTHFSVTGYSLGGLISRYMIGFVLSHSLMKGRH
jgi:dienelactone hydrolase